SSLYLPTAFLLLSQRFCRRWAEELLLLLQPLSVLTFQLDLLFEHRHMPVRPMIPRSTPSPEPESGRWERPCLSAPELSGPPVPLDGLEDGFMAPASPFQEWLLPQRFLGWKERLASTLRGNGRTAWAQPGQEESPAQPTGGWKPQWTKLWVAMKENSSAAGSLPKPAMGTPEAGEVYLEGSPAGEEKSEAGNGNERWLGWLFGANSSGTLSEMDLDLARSR
ncbi:RUN and SH3 domain-containing protein 1-like, partial [Notechis scutatus]|uniref:RUN and SH3 domain-containing protein 1-like n=1 Tax=Notechis scutatus TaxID=8663 RepID=A0A6J1W5C2_9SAUR